MIKNIRLQTLKGIGKNSIKSLYGTDVYWVDYEGVHLFQLLKTTKYFAIDKNGKRKRKEYIYATKEGAELSFMRKVERLGQLNGFNINSMLNEYKALANKYPEHHI